jgi:hypothetical protein
VAATASDPAGAGWNGGRGANLLGMGLFLLQLAAILVLAAVQVLAGQVRDGSRFWLSAAAGISVAFVFLHLLPEMAAATDEVEQTLGEWVPLGDHPVFLLALAGIIAFYGLERAGRVVSRTSAGGRAAERRVALVVVGAFALYYALIGYLVGIEREAADVVVFAAAMGVHFLAVDYGLRVHHERTYDHVGRWALAAAVVTGWALSRLATLPEAAVAVMLSVLAGAVILISLKEELPESREGRFVAFAAGAAGYALLLAAV